MLGEGEPPWVTIPGAWRRREKFLSRSSLNRDRLHHVPPAPSGLGRLNFAPCSPLRHTRHHDADGLAVLVVFLLAAGRANANECGLLDEQCCPSPNPACELGLVCNPNNISGCFGLVWQGGSEGGAAQVACPGT
jgi:hypothetical protein